jgi:hypothetical protein
MRITLVIRTFIIAFLLFTSSVCFAANHYIRAGATGSKNGSDWTNAYPSFASVAWTRGDTYYVAGGTYTENLSLIAAASGSNWIYIKAYGDSQVLIRGTIDIDSPYWDIDGITGTDNSGHGIKVYPTSAQCTSNSLVGIQIESGRSNVKLAHIEVQMCGVDLGNETGENVPGNQDGVYAVSISALSGLEFRYLYLHDISRNGMTFYKFSGTNSLIVDHCYLYNIWTHWSYPHAQPIQITAPPSDGGVFSNNKFINVMGTGAIAFLGASASDVYNNMKVYNNVFWGSSKYPDSNYQYSPGAIYGRDSVTTTNILVHNNTFYNIKNPETVLSGTTTTGSQNKNNIYENCTFQFGHMGVTSTNNLYYNNTGTNLPSGEAGQQNRTASAFVSAPTNFQLVSTSKAIGNGVDLSAIFTTDITGATRTTWDIGAYSYTTYNKPNPPLNLRIQ